MKKLFLSTIALFLAGTLAYADPKTISLDVKAINIAFIGSSFSDMVGPVLLSDLEWPTGDNRIELGVGLNSAGSTLATLTYKNEQGEDAALGVKAFDLGLIGISLSNGQGGGALPYCMWEWEKEIQNGLAYQLYLGALGLPALPPPILFGLSLRHYF